MGEGAKKRTVSNESGGFVPKRFRSLLVPVDLTPSSDRILGRVALLPLADDARVTLLHVVPGSLGSRDQRNAERVARKALEDEVSQLRKSLRVNIDPVVKVGAAARMIAACANAVKAELIVLGRGGGRAFRDAFLGSTAERVIRQGQLPVLVVRLRPRTAYRRPALALDFDQAAHQVLGPMLRIIRSPLPPVSVIHAFDRPYSGLYSSFSEDEAEEQLAARQLEVSQALVRLLATLLARSKVRPEDARVWKTHLRHGPPRDVITKAVAKTETDLLVLGTRAATRITHLLLGTVAGDVLRSVGCDVLVVPPRRRIQQKN